MKTKEQNFYFYNLKLIKNTPKKFTLKRLLSMYLKEKNEFSEDIKAEEKAIEIINFEKQEEGYFITYDIKNYGERKKIKDKSSKKEKGILEKDNYVQEFQYIFLRKVGDDEYNIVFQSRKIGITINNFFNLVNSFLGNLKLQNLTSKEEDLSGLILELKTYHAKNFINKLEKFHAKNIKIITNLPKDELEISKEFAEKYDYKAKLEFNIIENKLFKDKKYSLSEFIEKIFKEYKDARVEIKGWNEFGEKDRIFSQDLNYNVKKRINLDLNGLVKEVEVKREMKIEEEKLHEKEFFIVF